MVLFFRNRPDSGGADVKLDFMVATEEFFWFGHVSVRNACKWDVSIKNFRFQSHPLFIYSVDCTVSTIIKETESASTEDKEPGNIHI